MSKGRKTAEISPDPPSPKPLRKPAANSEPAPSSLRAAGLAAGAARRLRWLSLVDPPSPAVGCRPKKHRTGVRVDGQQKSPPWWPGWCWSGADLVLPGVAALDTPPPPARTDIFTSAFWAFRFAACSVLSFARVGGLRPGGLVEFVYRRLGYVADPAAHRKAGVGGFAPPKPVDDLGGELH